MKGKHVGRAALASATHAEHNSGVIQHAPFFVASVGSAQAVPPARVRVPSHDVPLVQVTDVQSLHVSAEQSLQQSVMNFALVSSAGNLVSCRESGALFAPHLVFLSACVPPRLHRVTQQALRNVSGVGVAHSTKAGLIDFVVEIVATPVHVKAENDNFTLAQLIVEHSVQHVVLKSVSLALATTGDTAVLARLPAKYLYSFAVEIPHMAFFSA